jgi:broad specificity phosphatase PhoE
MATTVTFVRHGRTGFNKEHRYQGWLDLEGCQLLQEGVNQARALGARWKQYDEKYDVVYSSDLGRALMTAQLVSEPIGHEHSSIRIETRLRERNFGRLQGMTGQEIQQTRPNVWTRMKNFDPSWKPEGGESMHDVTERAWDAVLDIVQKNRGRRILIVSHGGTISMIVRQVLGLPWAGVLNFRIKNTSITTVQFDEDDRPVLECLGDDNHVKMAHKMR